MNVSNSLSLVMDRVSQNMEAMGQMPTHFIEESRRRFKEAKDKGDIKGMILAIPRAEGDILGGTVKGIYPVTTPGIAQRIHAKEPAQDIIGDAATFLAMAPESESGTPRAQMKAGHLLRELRSLTEAKSATRDAVEGAIDKQTKALEKNRADKVDTIKGNLRAQREALTDFEQEKLKTAEKNKAIESQNKAAAEQVEKRKGLAKAVDEQSVALGKSIEQVEAKVYKAADAKFNAVRAQIGDVETPPDNLIAAVKNVETNILQDIPENVKEFRSILKLEGEEGESPILYQNDRAVRPDDPGYESLREAYRQRGANNYPNPIGDESSPLTWDKLQSLKSRIDARLRSRARVNGDLKRGLFSVRDSIVDEMGNMAEANGAGELWGDARDFWRQMREDFHEPTGPSGSGSPVAQALDAVDPKNIRQPFVRTQSGVGNRGVDTLRKYSEYGGTEAATLVEQLLRAHEEMAGLPKKAEAKPTKPTPEVKELPKSKPAPPTPEKPTVDLAEVSRKKIQQTAERIGRLNAWDARIIASSIIAGLLSPFLGMRGGIEMGASYVVTKLYLARMLEKPGVVEWIAHPPAEEIAILKKLPGAEKINIQTGLTEAAIQAGVKNLSPEVRDFIGMKNAAKIMAGGGAVKVRKPAGVQKKELQQMRSTNPNMPIGAEP
jgi:hypothetical protein